MKAVNQRKTEIYASNYKGLLKDIKKTLKTGNMLYLGMGSINIKMVSVLPN